MPLERCTQPVLPPADRLFKLRDLQMAEDVKIKTRTGALCTCSLGFYGLHLIDSPLVTLISAAIILTFTTVEFFDYRRVGMDTSIVVDKSRGQALTVWLNVTFPRVPCYRASTRVPKRQLS